MSDLAVIVLAAGRSRRMKSRLSKVLHRIAGRPLIHYPMRAAREAGAERIAIVASPDGREVIESYAADAFGANTLHIAVQDPPRGTGDAARVGLMALEGSGARRVLIVCGDVPLVDAASLEALVKASTGGRLALATCELPDPTGYGRILRDEHGRPSEVVEERDLRSDAQRATREVNAGLYCSAIEPLARALEELTPDNAQGEYYLTDIVKLFAGATGAETVDVSRDAMLGVNDRQQLCDAEQIMFARIARRHREQGCRVAATARIDDTVEMGADCSIADGVHLRGSTRIGEECFIDVGCVVTDSQLDARVRLLPYSVVSASHLGSEAQLGPFTHTRPGTELGRASRLGNFVETKNTKLGDGAKANHLAYLGDGDVGPNSNIGAGTIFCNYDGYSKHRTVIGRDVFIGSDSQLVAPVSVGDAAFVATACSVTEDVPAGALAIGRARQVNKPGRAQTLRERLASQKAENEAKKRR